MRLTIDTKTLQTALETVGRMVKASTLPMLFHAHVDAGEDGAVKVRTWNYSGSIETTVQAQVETPGSFTVLVKHAASLLKYLSGVVEISTGAGFSTVWKCGKSRHVLQGHDPAEYPCPPVVSDAMPAFSVNSSDLLHLLKNAVYAAGTDKTRPILNSVLLIVAPGSMYAVATDTHRLVKIGRQDASIDAPDEQVILSTETLSELMALLEKSETACLQVDDKFLRATLSDTGDTVIILQVVEGQYPNYSRIVPADYAGNYTFDVQELSDAVKRVALSADSIRNVKLQIEGSCLTLSASNYVTASDAEEEVGVVAEAGSPESYTFGVNCDFLIDALSHIGTEKARFRVQANVMRPVIIEPLPADGVPDRLALICAMNLNM